MYFCEWLIVQGNDGRTMYSHKLGFKSNGMKISLFVVLIT